MISWSKKKSHTSWTTVLPFFSLLVRRVNLDVNLYSACAAEGPSPSCPGNNIYTPPLLFGMPSPQKLCTWDCSLICIMTQCKNFSTSIVSHWRHGPHGRRSSTPSTKVMQEKSKVNLKKHSFIGIFYPILHLHMYVYFTKPLFRWGVEIARESHLIWE